jgi:hypothetical protein
MPGDPDDRLFDQRIRVQSQARSSKSTSPSPVLVSAKVKMSIEKLQAMIIKNQDEKLTLIEQKENLGEEDDWMGDDPEMIEQKL